MSFSNQAGSLTIFPLTGTLSNPMKGISLASTSPATLVFTDTGIPFDPRITFARSTAALRNDSAGELDSIAIDVARANANQDYPPPLLLPRGFLIEAGATNSIRNNTMVGAVVGTPGTAPTNWSITNANGLTTSVVGTGTENGIEYIDVRFNGTTTGTNISIVTDAATQIAALQGQTWTASTFIKYSAGALTNIGTFYTTIVPRNAGGSALTVSNGTGATLTNNALSTTRLSNTYTLPDATTAFVSQRLDLSMTNGAAVDVTLRIGLPQLEQNAFATSVIKTSSAATARGADNAVISNLASIGFSATQGFVYARFAIQGVPALGNYVFAFSDGTTNNVIRMIYDGTNLYFQVISGGAVQANIAIAAVLVVGTVYKAACSWSANAFRFALSGVAATEDTSGTIPTVDRFDIGRQGTTSYLYGWLPELKYGPQLLTSAQLASMTA